MKPTYLSKIPTQTPADPVTRCKAIDRKTDYVLSYWHRKHTNSDP